MRKKNQNCTIRTRLKNCLISQQYLYNKKTDEEGLISCSINLLDGNIKFYHWTSKAGMTNYSTFEDIPKDYASFFESLTEDLSYFLCEEAKDNLLNRKKAYFCLGCLLVICIKLLFSCL